MDESNSNRRKAPTKGKATPTTPDVPGQARKLLEILVTRSSDAEPIVTYAEAAKLLGIHVCNLKHPMDHLSRTLQKYSVDQDIRIPPIQTLIVNGKSRLPGPGASPFIQSPYVKKGEEYAMAVPKRQQEIADAIQAAILAFPDWKQVQRDVTPLL